MISMTATLTTDLDPRTTEFIARPQQMYVDGQWVESASGRRFDTVDPATRTGSITANGVTRPVRPTLT